MVIKNIYITVASIFLISTFSFAQQSSVRGTIVDSSLNLPLSEASIVLLRAKDSVIVKDVRSNSDGKFEFKNLPDSAHYILLFSYPKYADFSIRVDLGNKEDKVYDLQSIYLIPNFKLLEEVVIKAKVGAIRIIGDTTEYKADSFKVQPNANVEDLLKQLPGLRIDQHGNITAQGQKVKTVLVDGEEFFGSDPTLVTRNIRADMIDKVQVYDKKSDAASFTGINDGIKDKTINLKIKEDKNHGIFGKLEVGIGTNSYYNAQGMLNAFKGKRKMAIYGTTSNIGRVGLGSGDKEKIGDEAEGEGDYNDKGLPTATSAGAHYDNKWNADKTSINSNYKFNVTDIKGSEITFSQNNLANEIILTNSVKDFKNSNSNHQANTKYIQKFNENSVFTIYADGYTSEGDNNNTISSQNMKFDKLLINDNYAVNSTKYDVNIYNLNASWKVKMKKEGRTFSFYTDNRFSNDNMRGNSSSETRFYNSENLIDSTANLFLNKMTYDNSRISEVRTIYTEPLSKGLSLILNYTLNNEHLVDDKRSFNSTNNGSSPILDSSFSAIMNTDMWGNEGGGMLNYSKRKIIAKLGSRVKNVNFKMEDLLKNAEYNVGYLNWYPTASVQYNFSQFRVIQLGYEGESINPERTQLVPYNYNNSQLITYLPNLLLKNSFSSKISGFYNVFTLASATYLGIYVNYENVSNPLILSTNIDSLGSYKYQFRNLTEKNTNNYSTNLYYSKKLQKFDMQIGASAGISGGRLFSIINNNLNSLNFTNYKIGADISKVKEKRYEIHLIADAGYSKNKSSLQSNIDNNYFFYTLTPSVDIYFDRRVRLHSDVNYLWQQKTQSFPENFKRCIWNGWLGYDFLKNNQLTVKLSCNDILNENNGYTRNNENSLFIENRYSTIMRYFMIGAVWNFTKFKNLK